MSQIELFDGGLATQLEERGHDLLTDLWSARLLHDAPGEIAAVHLGYLRAGSDWITSASYQATIHGFVKFGCTEAEASRLLASAVDLAKKVRDDFSEELGQGCPMPRVAASIGPYGAYLANGAEFTGDYDLDLEGLTEFHRKRWMVLASAKPDAMLCETFPSLVEAQSIIPLAAATSPIPTFVSFSCRDAAHLSDGTPMEKAAAFIDRCPEINAIGINCTAPRFIVGLIQSIRKRTGKPILIYPNSGETFCAESRAWQGEADAKDFAMQASEWREAGAWAIGGCCRTTPEHISRLRATLTR